MTLCHAHNSGACTWSRCPQLRDGEPALSARPCPLGSEAHIVALRFPGFSIAQVRDGLTVPVLSGSDIDGDLTW